MIRTKGAVAFQSLVQFKVEMRNETQSTDSKRYGTKE